jgi:hypothetical protein
VPPSLREVLDASVVRASPGDAWRLDEAVAKAAERAFGPPAFVPFAMPPRSRA